MHNRFNCCTIENISTQRAWDLYPANKIEF